MLKVPFMLIYVGAVTILASNIAFFEKCWVNLLSSQCGSTPSRSWEVHTLDLLVGMALV